MRIYLGWSGAESYKVASALRDWLPDVLQPVEPWLAAKDIQPGARWAAEIWDVLKSSDLVILCVTAENKDSPWVHFEAGAASRATTATQIVPYLAGLRPVDLTGPMMQFQSVEASREGTWRLVSKINSLLKAAYPEETLVRTFGRFWPVLENALVSITAGQGPLPRSHEDLLEEVALGIRQLTRTAARIISRLDASATPSSATRTQVDIPPSRSVRPRVFIGSSSEGLAIAESIHANLDRVAECTVWNQGAFAPSKTTIESLVEIAKDFDFAVIVLTPDDLVEKRQNKSMAPRDNLIFELGLFTGTLGRARTFLVLCRDEPIELPSDLKGVTAVEYGGRADGNLIAALAPVSLRIRRAMGLA